MPYGDDAWLVTRMADVRQVLTDERLSRAAAYGENISRVTVLPPPPSGLLAYDGSVHRKLRARVAPDLSADAVNEKRPWITSVARNLWHSMTADADSGEFVQGFALELPAIVIAEILGVPADDRSMFRGFAEAVLSTTALDAEEVGRRRKELRRYLRELMDDCARTGRGLLSRLADLDSGVIDGGSEAADGPEIDPVGLATAILVAGFETTANQLANFTLLLTGEPEAAETLVDDPAAISDLVDELLRVVPLGVGGTFPRVATEDLEIGGRLVRRGEVIIAALGAANQDPAVFERPEEIAPERVEKRHVAFGYGTHYCLGARLARAELEIALQTIFVGGPRPRLADRADAVVWRTGQMFRGPRRLWLEWR